MYRNKNSMYYNDNAIKLKPKYTGLPFKISKKLKSERNITLYKNLHNTAFD